MAKSISFDEYMAYYSNNSNIESVELTKQEQALPEKTVVEEKPQPPTLTELGSVHDNTPIDKDANIKNDQKVPKKNHLLI